jgi:hypothetical protein
MANYEVVVLRVQGINKNTYEAGQKVTDDMFPAGNAAKMAKEGKLKLIEAKKEVEKPVKKEVEKTKE